MRSMLLLPALVLLALLSLTSISAITIHLVPHTHDDVGWQVTVDQYYIGSVQYIITTVIEQLQLNPERKFIYVEQAYFQRWWREQNDEVKGQVRALVDNGQLEFINGGWSMHDEASTLYVDMIDQTTYGHRFIKEQFGKMPKVGWQIDPFGHSATQASLLSAEVGFEALFFGRIDYQDYDVRARTKRLEWLWRASPSLGPSSELFTGQFWNGYGPPSGFNFDIGSSDAPIQDDRRLTDYNVDERVEDFVRRAQEQAAIFQGEDLMWTMGSDFQYSAAHTYFTNLDKLIAAVNADGRVKAMYSTPSIYVEAKNRANLTWTTKEDDIFPYADGPDAFWTGYFTSRPALKRYVRVQSAFLQVARHLDLFTGGNGDATEPLWEAMGVAQHHDGVSGTAKQAVTLDYAYRLSVGGASAERAVNNGLGQLLTKSGGQAPAFSYCPNANTSVCPATAASPKAFVVALYNPQARPRTELVRIPVATSGATVLDGSQKEVASQVVRVESNPAYTSDSLPFELRFLANVSGLGIATYFVTGNNSAPSASSHASPAFTQTRQDIAQARTPRRSLKGVPTPRQVVAEPAAPLAGISNEYWKVDFDANGLLSQVTDVKTGQASPFQQNFYWYHSFQHERQQNSGAYIFRPQDPNDPGTPIATSATTTQSSGPVTSEVVQYFTPWLVQRVRLTVGSPIIEMEYTVGPIPVGDKQGKEIVTRYSSSIKSNATWYTDSNGREWQQRIRNFRPTWTWNATQPVAGNYYPVNAATWLADGTTALSIVNDRSQGGSSLHDGELELMVHRRLTMDDGRGVGEPLNETGLDGKGLIITGTHYVQVLPTAQIAAATRHVQQRVYAPLHWSLAPLSTSVSDYLTTHTATWTALQTPLPLSVELMSAYPDRNGTVLIRLAHNFGVLDGAANAQPVTVDLSTLFVAALQVKGVQEVSLTANTTPDAIKRLKWVTVGDKKEDGVRRVRGLQATTVTISAAEIRTFILSF